ncbi:ankyrin-2-like [Cynara cardunculus var. scolymus]|uniref:ankyrin-2-like n=1 Tax=Cynara cardunculus var. scolymus TaxID=59895 RepID=UPI000D62C8A9|nr:ankyrin-2-like [Cynara cardunculus var. scolymus]
MTVFNAGDCTGGSPYVDVKQVFPVEDYQEKVSQRLIEAVHANDLKAAFDCLLDPFVDVNFVGTVCLNSKKTEIVLHDESPSEVRVEFEEFKTDVTALFLAAHVGNVTLVRKLLTAGANVNKKLFRGTATTAAARGCHIEILDLLLEGGASQLACEEALMESSHLGLARPTKALMASDLIRPNVAVHALVNTSHRGFVDVVETLLKCGVDMNGTARVLLRSSKPFLHADVSCNALVAATVNRHISVVQLLLLAGVRTDTKVRLGAWSWDMATGEEYRVGAGLAEPYSVLWCAVEYFEETGSILNMLLQHISPNIPHFGRTIIHHAILCANLKAVEVLLKCGADPEFPVETVKGTGFRLIHLVARLGYYGVLQHLVNACCNLDSRTESGETALMICARHKHVECLKLLAGAGADFGLVNMANQCVQSIAGSVRWTLGLRRAILDVVQSGKVPRSTDTSIFSTLMFVTRVNNIEALKKLVDQTGVVDLDEQDENGYSAVMVAVLNGHMEAFRLLVYAGANVKLQNKYGETAISLSESSVDCGAFEKVILECAQAKGHSKDHLNSCNNGFYTLHRAVSRGDYDAVETLTNGESNVNAPDNDGYTPLMLAAREGHGKICELLISRGAICDIENARHETALRLSRKDGVGNDAERVLLDHLARGLVLGGGRVKKHCKGGKGCAHNKRLSMVEGSGLLRWGKSSRRNVVCKWAEVGPSSAFRWNRRKKTDWDEAGLFRVVTTRNKEVHFVCEGGVEMAELWVRGITLVTREAIFGKLDHVR